MLKGRQSCTPAGREEPDDLHMLISSLAQALVHSRDDATPENDSKTEVLRRQSAEHFRVSAARQASG